MFLLGTGAFGVLNASIRGQVWTVVLCVMLTGLSLVGLKTRHSRSLQRRWTMGVLAVAASYAAVRLIYGLTVGSRLDVIVAVGWIPAIAGLTWELWRMTTPAAWAGAAEQSAQAGSREARE